MIMAKEHSGTFLLYCYYMFQYLLMETKLFLVLEKNTKLPNSQWNPLGQSEKKEIFIFVKMRHFGGFCLAVRFAEENKCAHLKCLRLL
jgi:hypothetical protein